MTDTPAPFSQSEVSPRIRALRQKIRDPEYIQEAIQRIALVISNELSGASNTPGRVREGGK
jgi:hypothetical protein